MFVDILIITLVFACMAGEGLIYAYARLEQLLAKPKPKPPTSGGGNDTDCF